MISLDEMKQYLRVDFDDDDLLLKELIEASVKRCMDIVRIEKREDFEKLECAKVAIMYSVAFQYENRENCDFNALNVSLRALLFGSRKVEF